MGTKTTWILAMALVAVGCGDRAPAENPAEGAPQRVATRQEAPTPPVEEPTTSESPTSSGNSAGTTAPDSPVSSDAPGATSDPIASMPTSPPVTGSQPNTGETQAANPPQTPPASELTDKYVIKTRSVGPGAMPEFRVTINGTDVASTGAGDTEITSLFNKGKNEVKVAWEPSIEQARNRNWYVELTLGMERGGKWSTIVKKQLPQTITEKGANTYTVMAR